MAKDSMERLENIYLKKILRRTEEIGSYIWTEHRPIEEVGLAETQEHLKLRQAEALRYRPARPGQGWGKPWSTAWFRLTIRVPQEFKGRAVGLLFEPGGESLVFLNGRPLQSLGHMRKDCLLLERARGGERLTVYVESGANNVFGRFLQPIYARPLLAVFGAEVWTAYWDLKALADMVDTRLVNTCWVDSAATGHALDRDDTRRARLLFGLNKAVDLFDYRHTDAASLAASARRVSSALRPLYQARANASAQTIACLGHAHIDVAWLWPLAETVRKCGRTFSNVVGLMEKYPEFIFCQSQPHLYQFTRDRYPSIYREIKRRVRRGQWVPTGCTWVEMDCNVTSGESLVRQVLFGTRFFRQEFGLEPDCLWLPDVFGYSAALPQILRRSGVRRFLTQKISWNDTTAFPHHSFYWEGIDGSRVLSHFLPGNDYNSLLEAPHMISAARNYRQKDRSPIQAILYGWGDGGGGPTAAHLERRRRYHDLEGMPKLRPMTPNEFFDRLEKQSADLPLWVGELYLECHRGTYTTRARNKRQNRKAELLLHDTEWLMSLDAAFGGSYDHRRLAEVWKLILLNQFHDIIPGSSIDEVYRDSDRDYAQVFATAEDLKSRALGRLASRVDTRGQGRPVVVFNSLSWPRTDCATIEAGTAKDAGPLVARSADGASLPVQVGCDGQARFIVPTPSLGYCVFHLTQGRTDAPAVKATPRLLENDHVRARFDARGRLVSLVHKALGREAIAPRSPANQFMLFEDKTVACGPAWDIDIYYNDKPVEIDGRLLSAEVVEQGPVRSVVRFRRAISKSTLTQDVILHAHSPRLDFQTRVDWGDEKDVMLKVAFPAAVRTDQARYEIQFGNLPRPTHRNSPQDMARFEVPAHRWMDLSEGDFGLALLNDCKYGHDTLGNVMRLTLLRASRSPGATADVLQTHEFTYSLLPHAGDYTRGVVRAGYELNVPTTAVPARASAGSIGSEASFFEVSGQNVILETVKQAEDGQGIIVRLYEAHGCRGRRTLRTSLPVAAAVETDLMEREERKLPVRGGRLSLDFLPFQIRTVKLRLATRAQSRGHR